MCSTPLTTAPWRSKLRKLRKRIKGLGGIAKGKEISPCTKDGRVVKVKQMTKDKLTDAAIGRLQVDFAMALRSGEKSVAELKNALLASFFHPASSEGCNYHTLGVSCVF